MIRGQNKVTFVFTVFVVNDHDTLTGTKIGQSTFDANDGVFTVLG
jgi:hypothetical protein